MATAIWQYTKKATVKRQTLKKRQSIQNILRHMFRKRLKLELCDVTF